MSVCGLLPRTLAQFLGLDILEEKYAFASDGVAGYTSAQKIPDRWVATTCGYCSVGCGMHIGVKDGRAVSVRGDEKHKASFGKLCPKGLSEHYTLEAENRLRYPMLRRKGRLERIGWDEALDVMARKFLAVQEKYGPQSLGVISTGQLVTEEFYALGKLVQLGLGTSNYCGNTTLCMATAVAGYKRSFGSDGPPGAYEDLEKADVIFLIGANIAENHPILFHRLEANPNRTLIVADPRVTKTAMMANVFLPLKPRSDLALVNGIAHILVKNGLINRAYIDAHTTGFAEFETFIEKYTPEYVSAISGLDQEQIYKTALLIGHAKAAFIGWTMGVNHSTKGTETVNAIVNLSLITGNVGRAGAAPFSITGQCNAMGTREAGFTSSLPGYRKFESRKDREELAGLWNMDPDRIPSARGLAYPDIIEAAVARKIRALWILGTNPMVSYPNVDVLRQGLQDLEFFVVQDGYHPTPTTELADLVLPAAIWGEKEGTYTNSERRVSKVNKAVEPPGEARSDMDIFLALARKLDCYDQLFPGWTGSRDAFEEWKRVSAGRLCDYSGMSYELIEEHGGLQWPFPSGANPGRTSRLYGDGRFETPDAKAKIWCADWEPFPEQPDKHFPLTLNTGRTVEHWHTRTKTGNVPILEHLSPRAWVEMNPADAKRLAMKPHEKVDIVSRRGRVEKVELRITETVAPGQIFMPFHFAEWNVNQVTQSAFDPISREPNYKQCAVRVQRAGA